jgi:hypothetical protein
MGELLSSASFTCVNDDLHNLCSTATRALGLIFKDVEAMLATVFHRILPPTLISTNLLYGRMGEKYVSV